MTKIISILLAFAGSFVVAQEKRKLGTELDDLVGFSPPDIHSFDSYRDFVNSQDEYVETALLSIGEMPAKTRPEGVILLANGYYRIDGGICPQLLSIKSIIIGFLAPSLPDQVDSLRGALIQRGYPESEWNELEALRSEDADARLERQMKERGYSKLMERAHELDEAGFAGLIEGADRLMAELADERFTRLFDRLSRKAQSVLISYAEEQAAVSVVVRTVGPATPERLASLRAVAMKRAGVKP